MDKKNKERIKLIEFTKNKWVQKQTDKFIYEEDQKIK